MSYRRKDKRRFEDICSLAVMRTGIVRTVCVVALLPDAEDNRKRVKIARKILTLCDGKDGCHQDHPGADPRSGAKPDAMSFSRMSRMCLFDEPLEPDAE